MREQLIQYRPLESNSLYQIVLSSSNTRKLKIIFANATTCFFFTNYCTVAQPSKNWAFVGFSTALRDWAKKARCYLSLIYNKTRIEKKKDFHSVSLWNLFSTWMLLRKSDHQSSSKTGIHPVISKYSSIFSMLRLSDTFRWKLLLKLWYLSHSEGFNVIFMKKEIKNGNE